MVKFPKADKEQISFRMPIEVLDETKKQAKEIGISHNEYLLLLVNEALKMRAIHF